MVNLYSYTSNLVSSYFAKDSSVRSEKQQASSKNIEHRDSNVTSRAELKSALRKLSSSGAEFTKLLGGLSGIAVATNGPAFLAPAICIYSVVWAASNMVQMLDNGGSETWLQSTLDGINDAQSKISLQDLDDDGFISVELNAPGDNLSCEFADIIDGLIKEIGPIVSLK